LVDGEGCLVEKAVFLNTPAASGHESFQKYRHSSSYFHSMRYVQYGTFNWLHRTLFHSWVLYQSKDRSGLELVLLDWAVHW